MCGTHPVSRNPAARAVTVLAVTLRAWAVTCHSSSISHFNVTFQVTNFYGASNACLSNPGLVGRTILKFSHLLFFFDIEKGIRMVFLLHSHLQHSNAVNFNSFTFSLVTVWREGDFILKYFEILLFS